MKNIILILLITLASCKNDDPPLGVIVELDIEISVISSTGVDLLNPNNFGSIKESEIKIFHLINGNIVEAFDTNKDAPRDFMLFEHLNEYRIRIFGNDSSTDEPAISYVEWNEFDTDTLKYQIIRKNNGANIAISKIWFNDQEVWDDSIVNDNNARYFEIEK